VFLTISSANLQICGRQFWGIRFNMAGGINPGKVAQSRLTVSSGKPYSAPTGVDNYRWERAG
jgi:hypothetical protein